MKLHLNPFLRPALFTAAALTLGATASADTIYKSDSVRVGNGFTDTAYLSLYNNGGANIQRSFIQFDLSSYSGKSITSDATLSLTAETFGGAYPELAGAGIGLANSAWSSGTITWANQPGLTTIAGATNPANGNHTTGNLVSWTIPWHILEKMASGVSGYNNGVGLTSANYSGLHFTNGATATSLTFTAVNAAGSTWTGGNGNWTDTANWSGGTVAEGIGQAATINGGTAVNITMDANRSVGSISFSGADHTISGSGKLALNVVSGSPTISVDTGRTATISATVVGVDGMTKTGSGTLTLTGANTYSGATIVSGGTLNLGVSGAIRGGGALTVESGATLLSNADWATGGQNAAAQLGPITVNTGGTLRANSAANGISNGLTLNGATVDAVSGAPDSGDWAQFYMNSSLTVGGTSKSTISAALGVDGEQTFNVADTGDASGVDLDITGRFTHLPNVRWGFVTKTGAGTMRVTEASGVGRITVSAGKLILEDNGAESTFGNGGLVNNAEVEFKVTSGSKTFAPNITGSGTVTKTGDGSLTLSGTNTYTGTTTVSSGKLVINGNNSSATGAVSVASGATLGGSGTVGGATTISGTHAPGNSPGVQSFSSNLSYASTSIFEWDLASSATGARGTQYDGVNVGGSLTGTSGAAFKVVLNSGAFTDTFWNTNQSWAEIFKAGVDGSGGALNIQSVFSSITGTGIIWDSINSRGDVDGQGYFTLSTSTLNWTAVPEPTSALAGLLLTAGLLRRRR
jgi:autotransporter-associated beta strand protein